MEQNFFQEQERLLQELHEIVQHDLPALVPAEEQLLTFTYGGIDYRHVENTDKFETDLTSEPITPLEVMKTTVPEIARSLRRKIIPPEELFLFGRSTRRKITRAAQLEYTRPPIDERVRSFVPFFKYLSQSAKMGGAFAMNQYYTASLWAAERDEELAAALMIYYGWPQDYADVYQKGTSIHSIERQEEGILVTICHSHTLQDRMNAACLAIYEENFRRKQAPVPMPVPKEELWKLGFITFYSHAQTYVSLPKGLHEVIEAKIITFTEEILNPMDDNEPAYPDLADPDDFLEDQEVFFRFADFYFMEEASSAQYAQRLTNNEMVVFQVLTEKLANWPRGQPFTRKDVPALNSTNLTSGVNCGFLIKPKHGQYLITNKLFQKQEEMI